MSRNIAEHKLERHLINTVRRVNNQASQQRTVQQSREDGLSAQWVQGFATCLLPSGGVTTTRTTIGFQGQRILSYSYMPIVQDEFGASVPVSDFNIHVWSTSNQNNAGNDILTSDLPVYVSLYNAELAFEFAKIKGASYTGSFVLYCWFDAYVVPL